MSKQLSQRVSVDAVYVSYAHIAELETRKRAPSF